jgi:tetratricopeptide (TPR) repeat protein
MTPTPVALLFTAVALLAGCAQMGASPSSAGAAAASAKAPNDTPKSPLPEPAAAPAGEIKAAAPSAQQRQQAQAFALAAAVQLESGHEEQAQAELQRALALDPNHKLALSLRRQITDDPVAMLGRESFAYTVRARDSLSGLAGQFLGDIHLFYALARYNGISVPRQLSAGQTLKIPGKAMPTAREPVRADADQAPAPAPAPLPPATASSAPAPRVATPGETAFRAGEAAEKAGDAGRAIAEYRRAVSLDHPGAAQRADQLVKQQVLRHSLAARTAFAKQDLDGAIAAWETVLRFDATNDTARLELQRCLALKEKVMKLADRP